MNNKNELAKLRRDRSLSQSQLAKIISSNTGHKIDQRIISNWEKDVSTPKPFQLQFLEDYFNKKKESIFFGAFNYKNELKTKKIS